jgi:hypothetical protein
VFLSPLGAQSYQFEVKKMEIRSVQSPSFQDAVDTKNMPRQKWFAIFVDYKVVVSGAKSTGVDNGEWLDDVELKWDFLYKPSEKAADKIGNFISFSRDVKYRNISTGDHRAVIFMAPVTLKRYFNDGNDVKRILGRFQLKAKGKTVPNCTLYLEKGKFSKKSQFATAFDAEGSKAMDDLLLIRDETPFRSIQHDNFDTIVEKK